MTDTTDKKRRTLDDVEHHKVMTALYAHLKRVDGETVAYETGWSDQAIADECGVTLNNVSGLRSRAFGKLVKPVEGTIDPRVSHLIAAHDALVRDIAGGTFYQACDPAPYLVGEQS